MLNNTFKKSSLQQKISYQTSDSTLDCSLFIRIYSNTFSRGFDYISIGPAFSWVILDKSLEIRHYICSCVMQWYTIG